MDAFQRCRRYHYNAYETGVRPVPSDDLFLGTVVHQAVAASHSLTGNACAAAIHDVLDAYDMRIAAAQTEERALQLAIDRVKVVHLIQGWARRWADSKIEIVAVEQQFSIPLVNPDTGHASRTFTFAGKIDAIVRLEDRRLAVYELKTMSDDLTIGSDYWKTKQLDPQIARYLVAARAVGYDCATILYDAIRKPEIRPKQVPLLDNEGFKIVKDLDGNRVYLDNGKPRQSGDAIKGWTLQSRTETPDEYSTRLAADIAERQEFYFARVEVPRLDHELAEAAANMWDIAKDIRNAELTGRHYVNTRSCRLFGRCAYLDVCTDRTDLSSGSLPDGFIKVGNIHPELTGDLYGSENSTAAGEGSASPAAVVPVAHREYGTEGIGIESADGIEPNY
jgi:hypothetical protein